MLNGHKTVLLAIGWHVERELQGIADYARQHRWHLVFQNGGDFERDLRNWRGDGIICDLPEEILFCRSWKNVAIVSLTPLTHCSQPYRMVRMNDIAIGRIAAEYFMKRNYRHYAAYSLSKRYQAFRDTLAEHGFFCDEYICPDSPRQYNRDQTKLTAWLKKLPTPCALFCENDWDAADAVNAAIWEGIQIPSELAILGVGDDFITCHASAVPISSVDCRYYDLGQCAAKEMDHILDGAPIDPEPYYLPPSSFVTERQSTDFFALENPKLAEIISFMRQNSNAPVTVREIAKRFFLSESALYKLYMRNLRTSPKQFLKESRLKSACEELRSSNRTLEEISENCGFPTPGAFFSAFRGNFHCSPGNWRKRNHAIL